MILYFENLDKVLDFAIENETEAYDFYSYLAAQQEDPEVKELLTSFAGEELNHKKKLKDAKNKRLINFLDIKTQRLTPENYQVPLVPAEELNYHDALVLAMQKELRAFRLYSDLAGLATDENTRRLFKTLAQEEAIHRIRIEIQYNEEIQPTELEE